MNALNDRSRLSAPTFLRGFKNVLKKIKQITLKPMLIKSIKSTVEPDIRFASVVDWLQYINQNVKK